MVKVQVNYGDTYYIIGDFWQIVERLKAHHARFRFRARRWRWPESLTSLERAMNPFVVAEVSFKEAQQLQLHYDVQTIAPIQQWVKSQARMIQTSVEWWEDNRLNGRGDYNRRHKEFTQHQERVALALAAINTPPTELSREQIVALQQTQRFIEKYEPRIVKWLADRAKERRREEILARFERELGYSRQDLLEAEIARGSSRQALYDELAGQDWPPHDVSDLKAAVRHLLSQQKKAARLVEKAV